MCRNDRTISFESLSRNLLLVWAKNRVNREYLGLGNIAEKCITMQAFHIDNY